MLVFNSYGCAMNKVHVNLHFLRMQSYPDVVKSFLALTECRTVRTHVVIYIHV